MNFFRYKNYMVAISLFILMFFVNRANAVCITPFNDINFSRSAVKMSKDLTSFSQQESNYIKKVNETLSFTVDKKLEELTRNSVNWMGDWAVNRFQPMLRDMMQQISVNYDEQSLLISKLMDARNINDHYLNRGRNRIASHRRYEENASAGVIDTFGPGLIQGYQFSKFIGYVILKSEMDLYSNTKGSMSEGGKNELLGAIWNKDYPNYLCNPYIGDIGCDEEIEPDVAVAGKHRDISQILWGPDKSIDMSQLKNRKLFRYLLRFFVYPEVNNPIPKKAFAREEILRRRADKARINTVYHSVAQMLSERIGGSSGMAPYTEEVRTAADVNLNNISSNPSYREINETLNKDRFLTPDYFIDMSAKSSEQVLREQVTLGALRLQMMDDLFRRQEEMLLMSASNYSRELDDKMPVPPISALKTSSGE